VVGETELQDEEFVAVLKQWTENINVTLSTEAQLVDCSISLST
jgi:hypothetical protein